MPRQDGRIEQGQSLKSAISARAWNRAQDAADIVLGQRYGMAAGPARYDQLSANVILIRNQSDVTVPWLGVLAVSGVAINPGTGSSAAREFAAQPVLVGGVPDVAINATRFVITMEPIPPGAIGRAAVSGCFALRVNVTNEGHWYAVAKHNDFGQLQAAACGTVQLLWKQPGIGENKYAVGAM